MPESGVGRPGRDPAARAPSLVSPATSALLVGPVRVLLGAVALAASALRGVSAGVALRAALLGAGAIVVALAVDPRRRLSARTAEGASPVPADARYASRRETALAAVYPSTVGLTALAAAGLLFDPILAAVLAGILLGMGAAALLEGGRLALWQRREGVRLYVRGGERRQLFMVSVRPRGRAPGG